jgi:NAD-dependent dihydropyrimidine dehydrogenase PreA subunit
MTGNYIITSSCECMGDCIPLCPVECIHRGVTAEGRKFSYVDQSRCVDCGACMLVCPIEGAVTFVKRIHN